MCLAVPGKIVEIRTEKGVAMATLDFDGVTKSVCLAYLPEATVGQYAIVHVGFAIALVDEASALETIAMFKSLGILEENLGGEPAALDELDGAAALDERASDGAVVT